MSEPYLFLINLAMTNVSYGKDISTLNYKLNQFFFCFFAVAKSYLHYFNPWVFMSRTIVKDKAHLIYLFIVITNLYSDRIKVFFLKKKK